MSNDQTELSSDELRALIRKIDRPLVLVGMMGVGKSSVGRKLATLLGMKFVDADSEIEEAAGRSITEIFAEFGEEDFRDGERRVIARLMESGPGVIATGGGAFSQDETRRLILKDGIAIWLDAELDTLVERVGRKDTRPLLKNGNPREILANLLEVRRPDYSQAPIHVKSEAKPHMHTINQILQKLNQWL
jgi:shikimate kinase